MFGKTLMTALLAGTFGLGVIACDVDVEEEGELPEVEVKEGKMPKVDVDTPEVDVHGEEKTITVPDVDVDTKEKTITVPDIDVTPADAGEDDPADN